jgi:hypothetical protein
MSDRCPNGHERSWKCNNGFPDTCPKCQRALKLAEEKMLRNFAVQQKQDAEQVAHAKAMAALDEQIEQQLQAMQDDRLENERAAALRQKEADLVSAKALSSLPNPPISNLGSGSSSSKPDPKSYFSEIDGLISPGQTKTGVTASSPTAEQLRPPPSDSEREWERQKCVLGESNDAIDHIMVMIGLEQVKGQVLTIKAMIEAKKRQNASFDQERFNIVLLGNPGTGETDLVSVK